MIAYTILFFKTKYTRAGGMTRTLIQLGQDVQNSIFWFRPFELEIIVS